MAFSALLPFARGSLAKDESDPCIDPLLEIHRRNLAEPDRRDLAWTPETVRELDAIDLGIELEAFIKRNIVQRLRSELRLGIRDQALLSEAVARVEADPEAARELGDLLGDHRIPFISWWKNRSGLTAQNEAERHIGALTERLDFEKQTELGAASPAAPAARARNSLNRAQASDIVQGFEKSYAGRATFHAQAVNEMESMLRLAPEILPELEEKIAQIVRNEVVRGKAMTSQFGPGVFETKLDVRRTPYRILFRYRNNHVPEIFFAGARKDLATVRDQNQVAHRLSGGP